MKKRFNYLQNKDAVNEILKHKWIESQKLGRNIGFATAALDWINKYGEDWKRTNNISNDDFCEGHQELIERRRFRRFKINLPIKIRFGDLESGVQIKAFNHLGLDFISDIALPEESYVEITLLPTAKEKNEFIKTPLRAKVIRSFPYKNPDNQNDSYLISLLFDKTTQKKIIDNKRMFLN